VTVDADTSIPDARHLQALWAGLLLPPVAFLANLEIAYALVPAACASRDPLPLHLVNAVWLVVAIVGGLIAWRTWDAVGRRWPDGEDAPVGRSRFLAGIAVLLSGLCVLVIVAQWIAVFLLDPCQ
jgi:hypothetical protein